MFIIFIIVSFFQASRRVDFSANPLADLSFDFYDESLLQEVGLCCFFYLLFCCLFIHITRQTQTEVNEVKQK